MRGVKRQESEEVKRWKSEGVKRWESGVIIISASHPGEEVEE